jgi:hypothetical protein
MKMKSQARNSQFLTLTHILIFLLFFFILDACSFQPGLKGGTPKGETPFIPPTLVVIGTAINSTPTTTIFTTLTNPTPRPTATVHCLNNLTYEDDLTLPDGTKVFPEASLDKRWQVKNSGSCNWTTGYQLRMIDGDAMGLPTTQDLYPARAGSEVVLRLLFTAPTQTGTYRSSWQAYDPTGNPFGDNIFIDIVVSQG